MAPTPGTSIVSTNAPVGNIAPCAASSGSPAAGSRNSRAISAAGNVTPSSSKSPSSTTAPFAIGTCATMYLPMLACQMRIVSMPSDGIDRIPRWIAAGPTAALRLPQFPLQSTTARSIETWPNR